MVIRLEEKKDWKEVENLTREAFWNVYRPGCNEHLVLHKFRDASSFIKELDYVIEEEGKLVAHIMYSDAYIVTPQGKSVPIIIFGPISVLPECQKSGYGSKIIEFTMKKATELGYGAIAITGNPVYYHRFGFVSGSKMNIFYKGVSREDEAPFFMVKELKEGYLNGITGEFEEPKEYEVEDWELEEFEKQFPPKEKAKLPGQLV